MNYTYGDEISYKIDLVKPEDYGKLRAFSCGNKSLDYYIHNELIVNDIVDVEDGLPYKVTDVENGEIIAVFSLAASGIINKIEKLIRDAIKPID